MFYYIQGVIVDEALRQFLIKEIADDLLENPDDSWHIFNGLKEGYPEDALDIGMAAIYMNEDRKLLEDPELKESLEQFRRGDGTVRL